MPSTPPPRRSTPRAGRYRRNPHLPTAPHSPHHRHRRPGGRAPHPHYWAHQARHHVDYQQITHNLHTHGTTTYLELGPDNTLTTLTHHNLPHHTPNTHPLLHPDHNDTTQLLTTLAHAHTTRAIDWATHYTRHTPGRSALTCLLTRSNANGSGSPRPRAPGTRERWAWNRPDTHSSARRSPSPKTTGSS
ncbi:hypothetical protein ACFQ2B_38915 [Streptomyces stramineus]